MDTASEEILHLPEMQKIIKFVDLIPFLELSQLRKGIHITDIGSDTSEK
jgi:hypothetical protein